EEESMILKMVDDICTDVVSRRAAEIDEQDEFPEDIYRLFVEQGLFSLAYGEQYGGCEVGMHCWVRMIERISKESPAVALMVLISAIGSMHWFFLAATSRNRPFCLSWHRARRKSASHYRARAVPPRSHRRQAGRGGWKVDGAKIFITERTTVFAKVAQGDDVADVLRRAARYARLVIGRKEHIGLRGSVTCSCSSKTCW
ncbi:MAG: acyl-CoA dehydrogenase family protein, partial [Eggerthellaceae bacterium]